MKNVIIHTVDGLKLALAIILGTIYKIFLKDKIYLIGERKDQCQDNGYRLFKYIRKNHPKDRVYYCITKNSDQLNKIKYLGNIVYYKSLKHYIYYIMSTKIICAHLGSCTPDTPVIWKLEEKGIINKYRIFIQHGITKEMIPSLMHKNTTAQVFICGAKPEYEFVKKNFGYPCEGVKYLGFCRFDNLFNLKVKNQILIMPTWRAWFGSTWGDNDDKEFLKSDYYKKFQGLIKNKKLEKYLIDNNMELIFYPHYEMQRYLKYFTANSSKVKIADPREYDVQELLKKSKILITDYSSIAFDFAYMRKPLIYYQFDQKEYYEKHYAKGYFDYERDGFGRVVDNEEDLIDELLNTQIEKQDKKYEERANKFFPLYDKENCKRHYYEIML